MPATSVKLMLLGIGVLLLGSIFATSTLLLFVHRITLDEQYLTVSLFALVGAILLLVGFFKKGA